MNDNDHLYLVIPGPVEVRREVLDAQSQWMIGHRSPEFADLFARLQTKLKQAFFTDNRVYIVGGSGTGFWEGAVRNCIRDDKKVLHCEGIFTWTWEKEGIYEGIFEEWEEAINDGIVGYTKVM